MAKVDRSGWAEKTRQIYKDLFRLIDEAIAAARIILGTDVPAFEAKVDLACALLFRRVITGVEAITLLISHGFSIEARIQSRSVAEALFRLGALRKDCQLFVQYRAQGHLARLRMAKDLLQLRETVKDFMNETEPTLDQVNEIITAAQQEIDRANHDRPANEKLRELKPHEWATHGEMLQMFWAQYAGLSQSVHHSLQDLECHIETDSSAPTGKPIGIQVGPDPKPEPRAILIDAIFSLYAGAKDYCAVRGMDLPKRISEIFDASVRLARN